MELNLNILDQYDLHTCNIDFQVFSQDDFIKLVEYCVDRGLRSGSFPEYDYSSIQWFSIYRNDLCFISQTRDIGYDNSIIISIYSPGPLIKKPNLKKVWI